MNLFVLFSLILGNVGLAQAQSKPLNQQLAQEPVVVDPIQTQIQELLNSKSARQASVLSEFCACEIIG